MANDPFQVGNLNPANVVDHVVTCVCCGLQFAHRAPRAESRHPSRCGPCADHVPAGTAEQQLEAMREHVVRVNQWADAARAKANEMHRDKVAGEAYVRDVKREIGEVLETRDRWRTVLRAVVDEHSERPDGTCGCGKRYPCATVNAMRAADPRIARGLLDY